MHASESFCSARPLVLSKVTLQVWLPIIIPWILIIFLREGGNWPPIPPPWIRHWLAASTSVCSTSCFMHLWVVNSTYKQPRVSNICSFVRSFIRSVHRAAETIAHFWNSVKVWTGLARQWLAIWLVDFAKVLSFSSYGWLTLTTVFDLSDDKSAHSWLPKYL